MIVSLLFNFDLICCCCKFCVLFFAETLRLHTPIDAIERICVKDYRIPDTNCIIQQGIQVILPIYAMHRDGKYYCEAEKFRPERFFDGVCMSQVNRPFLAFGDGPRKCIGQQMGMIQIKCGLITMLRKFKFRSPKIHLESKATKNVLLAVLKR